MNVGFCHGLMAVVIIVDIYYKSNVGHTLGGGTVPDREVRNCWNELSKMWDFQATCFIWVLPTNGSASLRPWSLKGSQPELPHLVYIVWLSSLSFDFWDTVPASWDLPTSLLLLWKYHTGIEIAFIRRKKSGFVCVF